MMIVACNGVSMLPPPLLCSSLKCRRKPVLLFSRENLVSTPGAGARACERAQKMPPLHLEVLCVGKDFCNKEQNTVSCTNIFIALFSSEMETTSVEPLG